MRIRLALPVVAVALAALLAGCTADHSPTPTAGSSVTVAVSAPFTSANPDTSYGATATNEQVAALTRSGFGYYDDRHRLVRDTSFGTAKIVSSDPFTVRYTVSKGVRWSDGAPIDATDLLLDWAAGSGRLNDPGFDPSPYVDHATGRFTAAFPTDAVWFDGEDAGLATSTSTPKVGSDGRWIEVRYAAEFADWPIAIEPTLAAHVVAAGSLGAAAGSRVSQRKAAIRTAILKHGPELAPISRYWNDAANLASVPADAGVLAASGPYRITAIGADGSVTLAANPRYRGRRTPGYRRIEVTAIADPMAQVAALKSGEVQVVTPSASPEVATALLDVPGVQVSQGRQGLFEHLDLQVTGSANGTFANTDVRRAFLHVVPRLALVRQLIQPIDADAQPLRSFTITPGSEDSATAARTNGSADYQDVDAAAATALLRNAGVSSPVVCVLFDAADARRRAEFEAIRTSAATAGFRVTDCSATDWRSRIGVAGAYDAVLDDWDSSQLGTAAIGALYESGSSANTTGFSDAKVDELVGELADEGTAAQRKTLVELDARLWDQAYGAPLFQYPAISAAARSVTGVSLSPQASGVFWNAWHWAPRR